MKKQWTQWLDSLWFLHRHEWVTVKKLEVSESDHRNVVVCMRLVHIQECKSCHKMRKQTVEL